MEQKSILSGIRISGKLHLGNYLGALKQFIDIQNSGKYQGYFFLADLHGLTTPFEPKGFRQQTLETAADFLAAGIDPKKSTIFLQNQVHEHSELAWVFSCITPLGELYRMTQFKDKGGNKESANAGLLTYPALMSADILLYKPEAVPVGEDQQQHIELARVIARKFNNKFGKTFPEPKNYNLKPLRLMSLSDPAKKMSKSEPKGCVFLDDEPDAIANKFKKAVTTEPGVDNLFFMLETFGEAGVVRQFTTQRKDGSLKFSDLKEYLGKQVADHFAPFRENKKALLKNPQQIAEILAAGAKKASKKASETMLEVKQKIGLL
jgi:tryptophanyl-tRNA synthetase